MGHGAPSETAVCDREPSGLFHGVNMGHGEEMINAKCGFAAYGWADNPIIPQSFNPSIL